MNNQLQANPSYVIEELVTQNAKLSQENAMLRAVIREQEEQEKDDDEKRKKRKRRKKNDKVLETETKVYNVIAIDDEKLTKLTMKRFNPEGKSKFNNFKNEMLYGKKNKRTKSDQIIASFAKRSVR